MCLQQTHYSIAASGRSFLAYKRPLQFQQSFCYIQVPLARVQVFSLMITTHNSTALKVNDMTEDILFVLLFGSKQFLYLFTRHKKANIHIFLTDIIVIFSSILGPIHEVPRCGGTCSIATYERSFIGYKRHMSRGFDLWSQHTKRQFFLIIFITLIFKFIAKI